MEKIFLVRYMVNLDTYFLTIKINRDKIDNEDIEYIVNSVSGLEITIINTKLLTREIVNTMINNESEYTELCRGLEKFVYFNNYTNQWIIVNSETNFNILNYLDDKKLNIYLIGDSFINYNKNEQTRLQIESSLENIFCISNKSLLFFNTKNTINKIDVNLLYEYSSMFLKSKKTYCGFIFDDNVALSQVLLFYNKMRYNKNIRVFIMSEIGLLEISDDSARNEIILRKR